MVTGSLASAGYFMGNNLYPPRPSNPKGFFESPDINDINEALLAPVVAGQQEWRHGQRWISQVSPGASIPCSAALSLRIHELTRQRPFCFKDPRFSYTLPCWRPHLPRDTVFVCVFRHPLATVQSMLKEVREAEYMQGMRLDEGDALRVWEATYRAILDTHLPAGGEWLFLHYDEMCFGEGAARLSRALQVDVDAHFPEPRLRRMDPVGGVPPEIDALHERLRQKQEGGRILVPVALPEVVTRPPQAAPDVTLLVRFREDCAESVARLSEFVLQEASRCQLLWISSPDARLPADLPGDVVRTPSAGSGQDWAEVLARVHAPFVGFHDLAAMPLPGRLDRLLEALREEPTWQAVVGGLRVEDPLAGTHEEVSPAGRAALPLWPATCLARRAALDSLGRTAFFPHRLDWLGRLDAAGGLGRVESVVLSAPVEAVDRALKGLREDERLLASHRAPRHEGAPELTVLLCTFRRRPILQECLESFCRQQVAPGMFEVILVDDDSKDGTAAWVAALDVEVPLQFLRRPTGPLAAARNAGLALARGRLTLFVNDDTIAFPDLVERHLEAHARFPGRLMSVLGTFEQPPEAMRNCLTRVLEETGYVFPYHNMQPGEFHDWNKFWTANVSVPTQVVRELGGMDEGFRNYGCEDTDLGLRLHRLGYEVYYEQQARAWHRHVMTFEDIRRRQVTLARSYVRFFRRNPEAMAHDGWKWLYKVDRSACEARLAQRGSLEESWRAGEELSRIDLGDLDDVPSTQRLVEPLAARLGAILKVLNELWWGEGFLDGFRDEGVESFRELLPAPPPVEGLVPERPVEPMPAAAVEPWSLHTSAPIRLLAWPRYDSGEDLRVLLAGFAAALGDRDDVCLCLRHEERRDGPLEQAIEVLRHACDRLLGPDPALEILMIPEPMGERDPLRLGAAVDAVLILPESRSPERAAFLGATGAPFWGTPGEMCLPEHRGAGFDMCGLSS